MQIDKDENTGCEAFHPEFPIGSKYTNTFGENFEISKHYFGKIEISTGYVISIDTFRKLLKTKHITPIE